MATKKKKKKQAKVEAEAAAQAEAKPELSPNRIYIECQAPEDGQPVMLELPPRVLQVIKDLRKSLAAHGDDFGKQIIRAVAYNPAPDGRLAQIELAKGRPEEVIKQLGDLVLSKEALAQRILTALRTLARVSGLRAATISYLVEEGPDKLTGGATWIFVPEAEFDDAEMSQLVNSAAAHGEEVLAQAEKAGRQIATQDTPRLVKPGDPGFRIPKKGFKLHP